MFQVIHVGQLFVTSGCAEWMWQDDSAESEWSGRVRLGPIRRFAWSVDCFSEQPGANVGEDRFSVSVATSYNHMGHVHP